MMTDDFETIIRHRTWSELSATEKAAIRDIAPDEAAFQTAKQILLLAARGSAEVPAMTRKIHYMPPAPRKKTMPLWYAAAGLLLVLSLSVWWYAQRPGNAPAPVVLKHAPSGPEKMPIDSVPALQPTLATTAPVNETKKTIPQAPEKNEEGEQLVSSPAKAPEGDASVFLASNEPALLNLVVEMY